MYDLGNGQLRNLVHFDDGGSGMPMRDEPLEPGVELVQPRRPLPRRVCRAGAEPARVLTRLGGAGRALNGPRPAPPRANVALADGGIDALDNLVLRRLWLGVGRRQVQPSRQAPARPWPGQTRCASPEILRVKVASLRSHDDAASQHIRAALTISRALRDDPPRSFARRVGEAYDVGLVDPREGALVDSE